MNRIPVWMDCDTGTDDAVAIMLAHASPELELLGISTAGGNTVQDLAYWNTQRLNGLLGTAYPVYRGAEKPLIRELKIATLFHGENGLGNVDLPIPENAVVPEKNAWEALYACAKAHPGELRLVATAPLTNIAIALGLHPDLSELLHSILLMGGSAGAGNVTPAAEFNIHADPHAAGIVFRSGARLFMFGLDVTLQEALTADNLDELGSSGTKAGAFVKACLQCYMKGVRRYGLTGASMHDACPVMYLIHPELFEGELAGVAVELSGSVTVGKTVTDLYSDKQFPFKNATVMLKLDGDRFISILKERILSLG